MKFIKEKVSALSGDTEVRFTEQVEGDEKPFPPFRLTASKRGIRLEGRSEFVASLENLQELAKVVSDCWTQHKLLVPDLSKGVLEDAKKL